MSETGSAFPQDQTAVSRGHHTERRLLREAAHTCETIQNTATWQLQNGGGEVLLPPVEYDCSVGGPVRVPGSVGVTFRGSCVWTGTKEVCTTINGWAQAPLFDLGAGVYGFKSIVFTVRGIPLFCLLDVEVDPKLGRLT